MKESMEENIISPGGETLARAHLTKADFNNELRDPSIEVKLKKEVPGLINRESNVSAEYLNEVNNFESLLDEIVADGYDEEHHVDQKEYTRALELITRKFDINSEWHMRKYTERFSPIEYTNVITPENKNTIDMIDNRVAHLYDLLGKTWTPELVQAHRADWEEALHVANEITSIVIYGVPSFRRKAA